MRTQLALCAGLAAMLPALAWTQTGQPVESQTATPHEVTVIGCLQRDADFRASNRGERLAPAERAGIADAYVLAHAVPADTTRNSRMRPRAINGAEAGVIGTSGTGTHYTLIGTFDDDRLRDLGRLVEIVGTVERPASSDALSRLTITDWHSVGDACPRK